MMTDSFMTPERRAMMAQALAQQGGGAPAGGDAWSGIRSGISDMKARYAPQVMSPGTQDNGGWQTSLESNSPMASFFHGQGGKPGGLLAMLGNIFNRGQGGAPAAPATPQAPYMRDAMQGRARQMAEAMATGAPASPAPATPGGDQGGLAALLSRLSGGMSFGA